MNEINGKMKEYKMLLANMRSMIFEDCRRLGIKGSTISSYITPDNQYKRDGDSYEYDEKVGYSYSFWERGQCNFAFCSHDELDFRFLCLRHLVYHDFSPYYISLEELEEFLYNARKIFRDSCEYDKALVDFRKRKNGSIMPQSRLVNKNEFKTLEILERFNDNEFLKKVLSASFHAVEIVIDQERISITTDIRDTGSYPVDPVRYSFKFSEGYGCEKIGWDTARDMLYYIAFCSFGDKFDFYCYYATKDIIAVYAAYYIPSAVTRRPDNSQVVHMQKKQSEKSKNKNSHQRHNPRKQGQATTITIEQKEEYEPTADDRKSNSKVTSAPKKKKKKSKKKNLIRNCEPAKQNQEISAPPEMKREEKKTQNTLPVQPDMSKVKAMTDALKNRISNGPVSNDEIAEQIIGIDNYLRKYTAREISPEADSAKERKEISKTAHDITEILNSFDAEKYVDLINILSQNLKENTDMDYEHSVIPEMIDDYEIRMEKELQEQTEMLQKSTSRKEWAAKFLLNQLKWANDLISKTEKWLRYVQPLIVVAALRKTENSFVNESVKCLEKLLKTSLYHSDIAVYKLTLAFSEFFADIPSVMAWVDFYQNKAKGHLSFLKKMTFEEYESKCKGKTGIFHMRL